MDVCRTEKPPLYRVGWKEHVAACYLYQQEEIA
jgi:hypothetical protein